MRNLTLTEKWHVYLGKRALKCATEDYEHQMGYTIERTLYKKPKFEVKLHMVDRNIVLSVRTLEKTKNNKMVWRFIEYTIGDIKSVSIDKDGKIVNIRSNTNRVKVFRSGSYPARRELQK